MIFKTIQDETTLSGQKIVSVLKARKIAQEEVNATIQKHIAQLNLDKTALTQLEKKIASGISYEEAYAQSMTKASVAAKEYALQTKGAAGTTDTFVAKQKTAQAQLEGTAISSKLASVGIKALSTAFNMFAGMAIMLGITKIIEGFNYLSQSAERAKEKLSEIQTELSDNNSSYENNRKTLIGLQEEYDALTKKAKALGGVQNLANDEYERYKEITSQILGITPKLTTGWNDEGVAISNKNNLLQRSIDLLDEEYEKSLRNNTTKSKNQDVAAGIIAKIDEFNNSTDTTTRSGTTYEMYDDFETELNYLNNISKELDDHDISKQIYDFLYPNGDGLKQTYGGNWIRSLINEIVENEDYDKLADSFTDPNNPIYNLFSDEVIDDMIRNADAYKAEGQRIIEDRETLYQAYKDQLSWNTQATKDKSGNNAYKQLSDNGKAFINEYIEKLDYASIKSENDFVNMAEDIQKFTKLLASNDDIAKSVENIFTPAKENETFAEYSKRVQDEIADIQKYCKENYIDLPIITTLDDIDRMVDGVKSLLQDDFDDKVGELTLEDLQIAAEQIEIPKDKLLTWDELIAKIKEYKESLKEPASSPIPTITSSIEQIATQLEPQFQKLGDAYKNIFTADGFTLDAVDNSMLEDLRKTFTEIEEEIGVTFDTTQLENFFAVLSNSNSTAEQTQEAFNNIATSYLYSTDVLESLNSTTVDSIAKQLESLGIINASQLATEALAAKEEYLAFARREHTDEAGNLVSVTQDLANATADDINVLIAEQGALEGEGIALDETTQKMIAYWMQKQAANGQLSTVGDIQQLSALCEGLGVSSKALRNYIYFKKLASMTDVYDAASIERFSANAEKNMEQAQADIQSIYDKLGGAEINFAVPDTSKKSKSEKDTTKEFDWIEQAIKNVEKEVTKLDNIVNSAYSTFSQKNEALAKEIGKVNEEIQLQQQAYDEYMRKADSIGLSDDYKTLIQNGEINIENISDKNLQERISEYQQWYEKAVDASDAISELSTKVKDLHVAGYELQADRLEELLDNEAITEKRYLSEMDKLYKQYYENQTDYAVQAHEAKLALLNREKEYLNSVANAATSLLDKEIDKVQDNAKEQQEPYEDQIKAAEKQIDAYEDQIKLFEKQIDAHNKQIDAYNKEIDLINDRKKPLQDELDALEDKAREENLILSLQEKQYNLKKAENQKDKLVNYMPDTIVI